ncbi:hypothetical protein F7R91_39315 [Streptomyces luteolifulvus]|jgi:hypothetical protein|uniref:Uncharacterized protein n=1 Tax=Streptomyces luteolifulvus TaxID=2615112 RepID=A0A6H9UP63_9ACTN|nr:hypothetical protein [Streptomyces luteolifulvus]KAB1139610.1 hypothetical protein F7R91_39315 [Streptomyces luteolifulvus]
MAEFEFHVDPADASIGAGLQSWLLADQRLRGTLRLDQRPAGGTSTPDEYLGDPLSILAVVLSTALALPAFLDSVRRWFGTQPPQAPPLTLMRGEVAVQVPRDMDAAKVAELAQALSLTEQQAQSDGYVPEEPC